MWVLTMTGSACMGYDRAEYQRRLDARGSVDVSVVDAGTDGTRDDTPAIDAPPPDERVDAPAGDVADPDTAPDISVVDTPVPRDVTGPDVVVSCATDSECDDANPCTTDRCDPPMPIVRRCVHVPVDVDRDGAPAATVGATACMGGTDCDDANPSVRPGAVETCNMRDDDCNGWSDDIPGCRPANEACTGAVRAAVTLPGPVTTLRGSTLGSVSGTAVSPCVPGTLQDVWYEITFPNNYDLRIDATGATPRVDPALTLLLNCTSGVNAVACSNDVASSDRNARLWVRADPAAPAMRRVDVAVGTLAGTAGNFELRLQLLPSTSNSGCTAPFDLSEGGGVYGPVGTTSVGRPACIGIGTGANSFVYNGPTGSVALLATLNGTGPAVVARDTSCAGLGELFCDRGNGFSRTQLVPRVPFYLVTYQSGGPTSSFFFALRRP